MRLIRSKIYRAFPELDRFSDEQCVRFVAAANASWSRRTVRRLIVGGAAATGVVTAVAGAVVPIDRLWNTLWLPQAFAVIGAGGLLVVALFLPIVGSLVLRDWLLRWRVRTLLARCGACPECHYSLLGMPVGPDLIVTCPECGRKMKTDPALGELATDESGKSVYRPLIGREDDESRRSRRARHRRFLKWSGLSIASCVLGLAAIYGIWWWMLVLDARHARAEQNTTERIEALRRGMWPGGPDADAREQWCRMIDAVKAVHKRTWPPPKDAKYLTDSGREVYFEPRVLEPGMSAENWDSRINADPGAYRATRAVVLDTLAVMRAEGLFQRARTILDVHTPMEDLKAPEEGPFFGVLLDSLGESRGFSRVCLARMLAAMDRGDQPEYLEALEEGLAVGRFVSKQGLLIYALVGNALETQMVDRVRDDIARFPDASWTRGALDDILRQREYASLEPAVEIERVGGLDLVQWFYGDPARVRRAQFGLAGPDPLGFGSYVVGQPPFPKRPFAYGTYRGNVRAMHGFFDMQAAYVSQLPWKRVSPPVPKTGYPVVDFECTGFGPSVAASDKAMYDLRQCIVTLAADLHRRETGKLAEQLADVLKYLPDPELVIDPLTGKPFQFEVGRDGDGGTRLIVVGGEDDWGAETGQVARGTTPGGPGTPPQKKP